MKLSTVIKLSLSALAITVSMPMKSEAAQAARARALAAERERLAAEAAAQQQAAQALVQQQALAQQEAQQALLRQQQEEQRQHEVQAQQALLRQQQEEQRQREVQAQQALARQQEEQRQREVLEAQEALVRQQEEQRKREEEARLKKIQTQVVPQPDLHPAWALFRDIKANYLAFTTPEMGEQKAREIATREVKGYGQYKLETEVEKFTKQYLVGNELRTFKEKFNALLKSPNHLLALIQAIQTHHEEELKNRQIAKAGIEDLEKKIQSIDNQIETLEKQLQKENLPQNKQTRKDLKAAIRQQRDELYDHRRSLINTKEEYNKVLNIAHFAYFNHNPDDRMSTEEKIKAVVDAALLIDPQLNEKAALFFARSISHAPKSGTNIDHRIGYARQTLEMMQQYNKGLKIQDLEINSKNNTAYNQAKSNLSSVHQHIQENFDGQDPDAKRLDPDNFKKAIKTCASGKSVNSRVVNVIC